MYQLQNDYLTNFKLKTIPLFKQGFKSLYNTTISHNKEKIKLLKDFQYTLENIPKWNTVIVDNEYNRFVKGTNCSWLGNLIMAVFKATTKQLLIFKNIDPEMDVHVPLPKIFIHACYIEIARLVWKKPQLLYHNYKIINSIKNEEEFDNVIRKGIDLAIHQYLPFESIVQQYIQNDSKHVDDFKNQVQDMSDASLFNTPLGCCNEPSAEKITIEEPIIDDNNDIEEPSTEKITIEEPIIDDNNDIEEPSTEKITIEEPIIDNNNDNEEPIIDNNNDIEEPIIDNNNDIEDNEDDNNDNSTNEDDDDTDFINEDLSTLKIIHTVEDKHEKTSKKRENIEKMRIFNNEINKSIKEIYSKDKIKRNEKKIRKVLGIKVDYDLLKNNPKKIRNYLLMESNKKWT